MELLRGVRTLLLREIGEAFAASQIKLRIAGTLALEGNVKACCGLLPLEFWLLVLEAAVFVSAEVTLGLTEFCVLEAMLGISPSRVLSLLKPLLPPPPPPQADSPRSRTGKKTKSPALGRLGKPSEKIGIKPPGLRSVRNSTVTVKKVKG